MQSTRIQADSLSRIPNRRRALRWMANSFLAASVAVISPAIAVRAGESESDSQSSAATKAAAIADIPNHLLNNAAQAKLQGVVNSATYFRRLPPRTIQCDAELFKKLVRYPEILIGLWDLMGVTQVEVQRIAPYIFAGDDKAGTKCTVELLLGNDYVHVYYANGDYTGKLVPRKLDGRSVSVIHSRAFTDANGVDCISATMDIFVKVDNLGADLLLRTLAPLVGSTADQNYIESLKFISQLSRSSVSNPVAVRSLIERVRFVSPEVKEGFIAEVYLASDRVEQRLAQNQTGSITQIK